MIEDFKGDEEHGGNPDFAMLDVSMGSMMWLSTFVQHVDRMAPIGEDSSHPDLARIADDGNRHAGRTLSQRFPGHCSLPTEPEQNPPCLKAAFNRAALTKTSE